MASGEERLCSGTAKMNLKTTGIFGNQAGKKIGYVKTGGKVTGLTFLQEGTGSNPFGTVVDNSWKAVYRNRINTEFVPLNARKWTNYRNVIDKIYGSDPDSAWERYCRRCEFYGLTPQPYIITVKNSLNGAMDGDYVEMGVENGHLKFQRVKDDDGFPDEISFHTLQGQTNIVGVWGVFKLIPHVSTTAGIFDFPKRIVREYIKADLQSGLPPKGKGTVNRKGTPSYWTHTTEVSISGGPVFSPGSPGTLIVSDATFDPCNGIYTANEDGSFSGPRGWSLSDDGEGWKFEKDGVYYYETSDAGPTGDFSIEKDKNYSGRDSVGKVEWQKFILAHNNESKSSMPRVVQV